MELKSLGYIGVRSDKLDDWHSFATGLLGMQPVDRASSMRAFRMDDRKQRLVVDRAASDGLGFLGWEVADAHDLDALAARLDAADVEVNWGARALAEERCVERLIAFRDPAGNRLEAFLNPEVAATPFRPGRPISGFKTGALGMGHVVLNVVDVEPLLPFYRDVLGFRVSDYGFTPTSCISSTSTTATTASPWWDRATPASTTSWSNSPASTTSARATTWRSSRTAAWPTRWAGTPTTT